MVTSCATELIAERISRDTASRNSSSIQWRQTDSVIAVLRRQCPQIIDRSVPVNFSSLHARTRHCKEYNSEVPLASNLVFINNCST